MVSDITEAEMGKEQMRQSIFRVEKIREKVVVVCFSRVELEIQGRRR